jgi:hypothetical protein
MYEVYNTGAWTEPCGTSAATSLGEESSPSTETLNFILAKRDAISLMRLIRNCNSYRLYEYSRPGCHVVSKVFSMLKNRSAVDILLLKLRET